MLLFLLKWVVMSAAFWISAQVVPGVRLKDFKAAVIASAVYATLGVLLGWMFLTFFTFATFGIGLLLLPITLWVTGTIIIMITDALLEDFELDGFVTALMASLAIAILSGIGNYILESIFR